jgi:hypothetical protein
LSRNQQGISSLTPLQVKYRLACVLELGRGNSVYLAKLVVDSEWYFFLCCLFLTQLYPYSYGIKGQRIIGEHLMVTMQKLIEQNPTTILPLSPLDFIQYVAIPHSAYLLVAEDHSDLDADAVWKILDMSSKYGNATFPDDE